jgi:S1-C subfamily serine protease
MLSPNGAFLTNWHSVENVSLKDHLLHLVDVDGAKYPVTDIHSYDQSSDLAFGEAVGVGFATGQLDKSIPVKTGDQVIVIGAPTSSLNNISQGHIVGAQDEQGDSVLEISSSLACADQGCSILNLEGKLIGFTRPVESKTAGLSYASTADEIYTFLSHAQTNTGEQVVP